MAVIEDIVIELGQVGLWIQALGLVVVLWLIFEIIAFFYNRKRIKLVEEMKKDVIRIEKKIDKIAKSIS